ncbi:245_t:CDS:2, partial [Paraglomus occultum]
TEYAVDLSLTGVTFLVKISLEEALSSIPPPVTYSPKCTISKTTTKVNGDPPTSILLWDDFLEEVNRFRFDQQSRFERPKFNDKFVVIHEEVLRNAMNVNVCMILNDLIGPDFEYSMRRTHAPGIPDFTCHYLVESLSLVIEVKRKHVLEDINGQTFPEFYQANEKAKMVIQQVYNYMGANELRYDFKFMDILGEGRSGKTLLCEFRGEKIALKTVDLAKAPSYVLEEMQKEIEIYESLADIQGQYIPKLVCHGYFGGGMCFIIGLTIVGTPLDEHKITKQQRSRALKALEAIHKHGILHNDVREENILVHDSGDIYLIDFGMASWADTKKKRKLFEEEQLKLSHLLDKYTVMPFHNHPVSSQESDDCTEDVTTKTVLCN